MPAQWGIWCISTGGWCEDQYTHEPWVARTRKLATIEMNSFTMKHTAKDYEVRKHKERSP